jgi:type 1 glutamine amidotransferase
MISLTRRSALTVLAGASFVPAARAAKKAMAFALIGDRYHNSDYIRIGLTRTIAKQMDVSIDFTDETSLLNAETLDGYKMLIVLRDGMIWPDGYGPDESSNAAWVATGRPKMVSEPPVPQQRAQSQFWIKPEQGKAVRQFVDSGGAALFLHNSTHVGLTDPDFRHVLGAAYTGHPAIRTFKVKVTNPDHPITQGVHDFVVTDEQHYMTYDKDPKFLFLQTVNEEGLTYQTYGATAPGGWSYDYGKGRVCYMSPGHMLTDLWNPEYIRLQQNAVKWVLKQKA